jgi:hypothetical protein
MDKEQSRDGHPSRREFLTRAGIVAGGMAVLGIPGLRPAAAEAAGQRSFTVGNFLLDLDGQIVESLRSAEGGFPKADVISMSVGPSGVVKKHVGPPKFEEIAIECDPVMPKPLFDWVNSALNMAPIRKSGAIVTADINRKEQSRLQFNNALITEVGFPTLDGSSKDPGSLTVKFAPEFTTPLAGKGADMSGMLNLKASQKAWLPGNFKLSIPGIDCSRVSKIDAFTIKQKAAQDTLGQVRDLAKEPGKLEFPNLALYVAEASAGTFYAWFQDMVLKGNSGEQNERVGALELLDPGMKSVLLTVTFQHLGIFAFAPEKTASNVDAIRRVKVEMYCEQITLTPGKAA